MWEVSENMKNQRNERPHSDAKRAAVVAVLAFLAGLSSFLGAYPVRAHESNGWVWVGNDRIYNYDYKSTSNFGASGRDWPVHIMFWNNATVNGIKAQRQDHFPYNCNDFGLCNMNFRYDTAFTASTAFAWETDGGMKEFRCGYSGGANVWSLHYRAYDDQGAALYSPGWGFYVPVTTHYDYDDPTLPLSSCDNKQHGYDETAESNVVTWIAAEQGWSYWRDAYHWHNPIGYRLLGGIPHYGNGNGSPSEVQVP
jgi:hypothetical protein